LAEQLELKNVFTLDGEKNILPRDEEDRKRNKDLDALFLEKYIFVEGV
jgi:hypothetical protein